MPRVYDLIAQPHPALAKQWGVTEYDVLKANCLVAHNWNTFQTGGEADRYFNRLIELAYTPSIDPMAHLMLDKFDLWKLALTDNPKLAVKLQYELIGGKL